MQATDMVRVRAASEAPALPLVKPRDGARWGRVALFALAATYLAIVLAAPVLGLLTQVWGLGLGHALGALGGANALFALRMTFVLVGVAVVVNAVVGTVGAIALVRHRFFGRRFISSLCDLPLAVSPVMIGLAFLLLVGRGGWLAPWLDAIGLKVVFAFWGMVVATLFVTLPYTLREVAYVLEERGTTEEEAAATLGASPWQAFWRVTFPTIRLPLAYGLLMTAARALGEFGAILVLGGSISGQTQTATTFIHDAIEERRVEGAYGMAFVLAAISVTLLLALEWLKTRGGKSKQRGQK